MLEGGRYQFSLHDHVFESPKMNYDNRAYHGAYRDHVPVLHPNMSVPLNRFVCACGLGLDRDLLYRDRPYGHRPIDDTVMRMMKDSVSAPSSYHPHSAANRDLLLARMCRFFAVGCVEGQEVAPYRDFHSMSYLLALQKGAL